MAPKWIAARLLGRPARAPRRERENKERAAAPQEAFRAAAAAVSALLLVLDVLDHLGHVVLVLAELGGVLDHLLLFLLLALGGGLPLLFLGLDRLGVLGRRLLGLGLGIDLVGGERRHLLLGDRRRAGAAGLEEGLGIEPGLALRALDLADRLAEIVVARPARRADALRSPLGLGHGPRLPSMTRADEARRGAGLATGRRACQKQKREARSTREAAREVAAFPRCGRDGHANGGSAGVTGGVQGLT